MRLIIANISLIFERMSATRCSLTVRRNNLIKSIKNIQREQIMSGKRQALTNTLNPPAQVHRIKSLLQAYNIQYFPSEISQILASIGRFLEHPDFCSELKASCLMEDLFQLILGELARKPYLQAPQLVENVICVTQGLVARASYFLDTIEEHLGLLLFAIQKYPLNHKIVEKLAGFINYTQLANTRWKQEYLCQRVPEQKQKIIGLMDIYFLRESYEVWSGSADFVEFIERGQPRWLKNAAFVLEISYSLLLMSAERQDILKDDTLKSSLFLGLKLYAEHGKLLQPLIQQESSDGEFWSDSTHDPAPGRQTEQKWNYFMILLLDIFLLRQELISKDEGFLLKSNLETALEQLHRSSNVGQVAVKMIRILYQQVILDEQDLEALTSRYPPLAPYIETIINSDFL